MNEKDKEVFKTLKEKDEKIYKAEKQFYEDAHSGDFRECSDYDKMTPQQIAKATIEDFKKNIVIVEKTTLGNPNYDHEKENFKKCPICKKVIDYHICGFYHDEILNIWICCEHKLEEIQKVVELKDKDLIEFIKAEEKGKQIVFI